MLTPLTLAALAIGCNPMQCVVQQQSAPVVYQQPMQQVQVQQAPAVQQQQAVYPMQQVQVQQPMQAQDTLPRMFFQYTAPAQQAPAAAPARQNSTPPAVPYTTPSAFRGDLPPAVPVAFRRPAPSLAARVVLLNRCAECHQSPQHKGGVTLLDAAGRESLWRTVRGRTVPLSWGEVTAALEPDAPHPMPPEGQPQLTAREALILRATTGGPVARR